METNKQANGHKQTRIQISCSLNSADYIVIVKITSLIIFKASMVWEMKNERSMYTNNKV